MHESSFSDGVPPHRVFPAIPGRRFKVMGEIRSDLVVYLVRGPRRKVIYVGQGSLGRAKSHLFPCKYKILGLTQRPTIEILASGLTRAEAISKEKLEIKNRRPSANKALWSGNGGLLAWNSGTKGLSAGGRPVGIPMTDVGKEKLSKAMMGKARSWMTGKTPWNKGLTKDDPRVAKGIESYAPKRSEAGFRTWETRRKNSK